MGLGSNGGNSPKIFLSIGFGKIRQKSLPNKEKVDANTPGAVVRKTQQDKESWAIEHDFVSGKIEKVFYKVDSNYGNSFEVTLDDGESKYQISLSEGDRYCNDFLEKLQNIDLLVDVKLTAYDFEDKDGKRRCGLSIVQEDKKIVSFYKSWGEDGKCTISNGYPSGDGVDFYDKEERDIYNIKLKKFLREEFNKHFANSFGNSAPINNIEQSDIPPTTEKSAKDKAKEKQADIFKPDNETDTDLPF